MTWNAMLAFAINSTTLPVPFATQRAAGQDLPGPARLRWNWARRKSLRWGPDGVILCCGTLVSNCLQAVETLQRRRTQASASSMHASSKPIDRDLIARAIRECGFIVTVEEGALMGGFGSAVLEAACDAGSRDLLVFVVLASATRICRVRGPSRIAGRPGARMQPRIAKTCRQLASCRILRPARLQQRDDWRRHKGSSQETDMNGQPLEYSDQPAWINVGRDRLRVMLLGASNRFFMVRKLRDHLQVVAGTTRGVGPGRPGSPAKQLSTRKPIWL